MTTRSDQKFRYGTREDLLRRGSGISGEVPVSHGKLELRELEIALNSVSETGGQNLKQTVDDIVSLIRGPLSRYLLEIGRFINSQGEVKRLSEDYKDDLGL